MSQFLTSLWESVFTPGTTPTLLLATNASFGCLQLLLLVLLFFTYSYHFLILSVLCGGLWWGINWFAAEVAAAKAADDKRGGDKKGLGDLGRRTRGKSPGEGSDTETELDQDTQGKAPAPMATGTKARPIGVERRKPPARAMPPPPAPPPVAAPVQAVPKPTDSPSMLDPNAASIMMGDSDLLKRRRSLGESSGYVSTDSEWEKVSEGEGSGKK